MPPVSIIIPAWNEEKRLARTLDLYLPFLEAQHPDYETIVVADGVADRTVEVADRYSSRGVRVLRFPTKLGKGGAILEGLAASRFPIVGFIDADCTIPGSELMELISAAVRFPCVVGRRIGHGRPYGDSGAGRSLERALLGGLWRAVVRALFFLPVTDPQCGAKFFQRESIRPILQQVEVTDWAFDVSLLYHIWRAGITIHEVPVSWIHLEGSKLSAARVSVAMFMSAVGMRMVNSPLKPAIPPGLIDRLRLLMAEHPSR